MAAFSLKTFRLFFVENVVQTRATILTKTCYENINYYLKRDKCCENYNYSRFYFDQFILKIKEKFRKTITIYACIFKYNCKNFLKR